MIKRIVNFVFLPLLLSGCGAYFNQPTFPDNPRIGELTESTVSLRELPLPKEPVVVGVYNFKDQTGQYKNVENGSTFSTAVPQGATSILIKALEDSKWFTPIERENLSNLLNERNIIRTTRAEYRKNSNPNEPNLPPLLYAGILLEGGIISYDTNILTGGFGARYFGVGGSTQYRQDRITVYLRAVSTVNGKILKTVNISKTILSQAIDAGLFRYVKFKRLLETETGFTKNEPVQLALQGAIETAVENLIVEGIKDGLWDSAKGERADKFLVDQYETKKKREEHELLYNRKQRHFIRAHGISMGPSAPILLGDYTKKSAGIGGSISFKKGLGTHTTLGIQGEYLYFTSGKDFYREYMGSALNFEYSILPFDTVSPYLYGGTGILFDIHIYPSDIAQQRTSPFLRLGAGIKTRVTNRWDVYFYAEGNQYFNDALDGAINGSYNDRHLNLGFGMEYKFGKYITKKNRK